MIALGITSYGSKDANFINNGTLNVNQYGAIAGYLKTTNNNGSSVVDLSSVSDPSNLAMSTKEGNTAEYDTPVLEFKGPFYDESNTETGISNSIFEPSTVYHSHSGLSCYDGNINRLQKVTINVAQTNYVHNAYEYTLYTNDSATDSGATLKYEAINNITSNNLEVANGSYIKSIDSKCESILINGEAYSIGTWYKVSSETIVLIQPKEAFKITCYHTNGNSGAGNIERSITYGPDKNSMTFTESTTQGARVTAVMPKGWVFKVADNAKVSGASQVIKTTYDENGKGTKTTLSNTSGKIAWSANTIYVADGDYEFVSDNVTCLVEGTDILMADNSIKKVQDLKVGDLVKVFNHETGKMDVSPIIFITHEDEAAVTCDTIELCFETGVKVKIANDHAFFDRTTNRYEVINATNYTDFINHDFAINDNDKIKTVKLKSAVVKNETVKVYCPVTAFHLNLFANGLLSMPTFPYDIRKRK